jgi:hypothetical protein
MGIRGNENDSLVVENQGSMKFGTNLAHELAASLRIEKETNKALQAEIKALEKQLNELQQAPDEIKVLRGLLPICSFCNKIRSDDQHWQQLERYIIDHSEAKFTHGACPECFAEYYSEYVTVDRAKIKTWASPNQKIKLVIDTEQDISIVRMENGFQTADEIAALDRLYEKEATSGFLWDLTAVEILDFDNIERDANYRIDRVLNNYQKTAGKRKRTAGVFSGNPGRMEQAIHQTLAVYRSKTESIEFEVFTDIGEAMTWINEEKDCLAACGN